jgi:delta 1-pyrroline-5-carboxylate dehydrogenase
MVGCQSFGGWKASGTTGKGTGGSYHLSQFLKEQSQTIVMKGTEQKRNTDLSFLGIEAYIGNI